MKCIRLLAILCAASTALLSATLHAQDHIPATTETVFQVLGDENRLIDCLSIGPKMTPGLHVYTDGPGVFVPAQVGINMAQLKLRSLDRPARAALARELNAASRRLVRNRQACQRAFSVNPRELPRFNAVRPSSGRSGQTIRITGRGLSDTKNLFWGDGRLPFTVVSDNELRFVVPHGVRGARLTIATSKAALPGPVFNVIGMRTPRLPRLRTEFDFNRDGRISWEDMEPLRFAVEGSDLNRDGTTDVADIGLLASLLDALQWRRWSNPRNPFDADNDGTVGTADVDHIRAQIAEHGSDPLSPLYFPKSYADVDGNNLFNNDDVLAVQSELGIAPRPNCTNGKFIFDVNGDGYATTMDGNLIDRYVAAGSGGRFLRSCSEPPYHDVDGNGVIDEADADMVFAFLGNRHTCTNRRTRAEDVNDSGSVTAFDALQIINLLNTGGGGPLTASCSSAPFLDVDGNRYINEDDATRVIAYLNAHPHRCTNSRLREDVTGDGLVNTLDTIALINFITEEGRGGPLAESCGQAPFYDVDGNQVVDRADITAVVTLITTISAYDCTNASELDVNDSGDISERDLLLIRDYLNEHGAGPLRAACVDQPYRDVNNDKHITQPDADIVSRYLDR